MNEQYVDNRVYTFEPVIILEMGYINVPVDIGCMHDADPRKKDWLAWLEKQKEFVSVDFDDVWETADCDELTAPLEKYSKDAIKKMCHAWYDKGIELERRNWFNQTKQEWEQEKSEDERIRKGLINGFKECLENCQYPKNAVKYWHHVEVDSILAWLEKQGEKKSADEVLKIRQELYQSGYNDGYKHGQEDMVNKEYVFRPVAGTMIENAVEQALKQGDVVLAFNGFYTPVKNKTSDEILAEYDNWLEKQGKSNSQTVLTLPKFTFNDVLALQCCMETVKKVQEDKELYKKLNDLHSKVYDSYQLEKQGEQPTDPCTDCINDKGCVTCVNSNMKETIKSKPKVGDWITATDEEGNVTTEKIIEFWGDKVRLIDTNGFYSLWPKHELNYYHLWSINDAKGGDVLVTEDYIFIFKYILHGGVHIYCHYNFYDEEFDSDIPDAVIGNIHDKGIHFRPATKEQRDLLFQKMKNEGYQWDAEKKELKKMEVASKEGDDERIRKGIISNLQYLMDRSEGFVKKDLQERITWLENQVEQKTNPCTDCTNDKGCVTCEHGELRETPTRTLNADKVIEWIGEHVPTKFEDMENYVQQFKQDFGL